MKGWVCAVMAILRPVAQAVKMHPTVAFSTRFLKYRNFSFHFAKNDRATHEEPTMGHKVPLGAEVFGPVQRREASWVSSEFKE